MPRLKWITRPGTTEDHRFVFSSFLHSYVDTLPGPQRATLHGTCQGCGSTVTVPVAEARVSCPMCDSGAAKNIKLELGDFQALHADMEARLPKGTLLVACNPADPDLILGWTLYQPSDLELVYVYVKQNYRSQGVATDLLQKLIKPPCRVIYPYATRGGTQLLLRMQDAHAPGKLTFCYLP